MICRFLPDGTITFVNKVYCRKFGKASTELIGQRWHPIAYPDDVPLIEAKLREMSVDNPVVTIENRVYVDGGDLRWMQFVNRAFYDDAGSLVEIQSVGRDITSLKQIEAALRESEATLERAQAVASIGSFAMGSDTELFTYTKETGRLFGLDEQGYTSFGEWFSRVHTDDKARVEAAWRNALNGVPYDTTYRIVVHGEVVWIRALAKLTFDDKGHLLSGVGTVQDITVQRRAENALRKSEERLEMALAGSGLALWDWDIQAHEVTGGGRIHEMLGLASDKLRQSEDDWMQLIDPRDREQYQRAMTAYLQGESASYHSEHRLRHSDGYWVTVEARALVSG